MSPTGPSTDRLFHADKLYCTQLFTKKELIKYLEKQSNFFFFLAWKALFPEISLYGIPYTCTVASIRCGMHYKEISLLWVISIRMEMLKIYR